MTPSADPGQRDATPGEVRVDPAPFDFQPDARADAAALCLHGLTGTPYEVRPLGEAIAAAGIHALGPALPGHNSTPEQLAGVDYLEWLDAARAHLSALHARYERVFVVGLSMGGLLSLALAAEARVDALVVVGTPLKLTQPLAWLIPLVKHIRPMAPKRGGSDMRDPAARERHPSYDTMPLHSVHQLQRLQRVVRPLLSRIDAPILVAHGAHDQTANPADARTIIESVSSEIREHLVLEASGHVVPVDIDGAALSSRTSEFLTRFR